MILAASMWSAYISGTNLHSGHRPYPTISGFSVEFYGYAFSQKKKKLQFLVQRSIEGRGKSRIYGRRGALVSPGSSLPFPFYVRFCNIYAYI